jgi:hypothetical protein
MAALIGRAIERNEVDRRLVEVGSSISFRHPMIRSAAYRKQLVGTMLEDHWPS